VVFVRDTGSVYNAPLEEVWRFLSDGPTHSAAHQHRNVERKSISETSGISSWEQDFEGKPERFSMRWTSFPLFGIAYEVLEGPLVGSKFFVYYRPRREQTRVTVVGDFVSPSIPEPLIEPAVLRFFALEYEQDNAAISARSAPK
jgi:hypothetical protein